MLEQILPRVSLVTPNLPEAQRLTGQTTAEACAEFLLQSGANSVLITGGHNDGETVINRYFDKTGEQQFEWERLHGEYHGSGCTLASALALFLAREMPVKLALRFAQAYTHDTLVKARQIGKGQQIPQRIAPP